MYRCYFSEERSSLQYVLHRFALMYLAGVLSSLEEASAEHGGCDPVWVGALTVLLGQDGQIQAVQALQTADWVTDRKMEVFYFILHRCLHLQYSFH